MMSSGLEWMEQAKVMIKSPALLIPLITASSYLLAYVFEATYLSYFGVSHQFVQITVNIFVLSVLPSMLVVFYSMPIISSLGAFYYRKPDAFRKFWLRYIFTVAPTVLFTLAACLYLKVSLFNTICFVGATVLAIVVLPVVDLVPFVWKHKGARAGIGKKVRLGWIDHQQESPEQLFPVRPFIYLIVVILSLLSSGVIAGHVYAYSRSNFLTYTHAGSKYIVVRDYPDKLLLVSVGQTDKLGNQILLLPTDSSLIFVHQKIESVR